MSARRLLLDVDGTVCRNLPRICEHVNDTYGLSVTPEEVTEWSYHFEEIDQRIGEVADDLMRNKANWYIDGLAPLDDARVVLTELQEAGFEIVIVTHRLPETHEATRRWFDDHGIPFDEFVEDVPENKAELRGDVLIDDHHRQVEHAVESGKVGILMDQPYNQPVSHGRAVTVTSWIEIRDVLADQGLNSQEGDSS